MIVLLEVEAKLQLLKILKLIHVFFYSKTIDVPIGLKQHIYN